MDLNPERREKTRFEHETQITLENEEIGVQRGIMMYNFSTTGLYIETDTRLEADAEIRIGINNSPFAQQPDKFESYRGSIKWRKTLKRSSFYYGYGVELKFEDAGNGDQDEFQWSRVTQRKSVAIPVKFEFDNQIYSGTTENVSTNGIAVKSMDPVKVGQEITVVIPLKKKGKLTRRCGKVSWANRKGFGVEFLRPE